MLPQGRQLDPQDLQDLRNPHGVPAQELNYLYDVMNPGRCDRLWVWASASASILSLYF